MAEWKSDRYWRNRPVAERLKNARIPARYDDRGLETYDATSGDPQAFEGVQRWITKAEQWVNDGMGLFIFGPTGTGKTHLAQAALRKVISDNNLSGIFITADRYLDMVYDELRNDGELSDGYSDPNLLMYMRRTFDLLVLDALGSERTTTDFARNALIALLNNRYEEKKTTIITSLLSPDSIASRYGNQVMSILLDSCFVIETAGKDYRLRHAGK